MAFEKGRLKVVGMRGTSREGSTSLGGEPVGAVA